MEDLIKRSDAIEQFNEAISICPPCMKGTGIYRTSALEEAIDIINQIPSAGRPQGHYIKGRNGEWYCSECKRIDDKYSVARFCWWCGARMKGTDDD